MNIIPIIDKKRRGETHTEAEIQALVKAMMSGDAHDYQISAWLMAACINGLDIDETTWLTKAFVDSGKRLDLSHIDGVVVDKHSTGGVGDKTTLALIPLLAAAGLKVAKLSGRGLGFTGGTIDKLEAIPNFRVSLSNDEFIAQIQRIGVAISSQTSQLAPADGRMYALRDVTATVESIPLIAASVVSKKVAAGADVVVVDIKYGRGAFMHTLAEAKGLATTCRQIGKRLGKKIYTLISGMEQPLGLAIGHTVEVQETIDTLKGKGPKDLEDLVLTLGAMAMVGAGKSATLNEGKAALAAHLQDGTALAKFRELIVAQGGEPMVLEHADLMPQPGRITMVPSPQAGYVADIDALKIAQVAKLVGAGRVTKDSVIDLGVGVLLHKKIGDPIAKGETLVELYSDEKAHQEARQLLLEAFSFSDVSIEAPALIEEVVMDEVHIPMVVR